MSTQAPKDETLQQLCRRSTSELSTIFASCRGREVYGHSLKSLVRDLAEEPQLRERSTLVSRLQTWITEAQSGKGTRYLKRVKDVKLLAFGSSVMGISNRDGDLDISLEGAIRDRAISPTGRLSDAARGFKADLLAEVHEILRRGQHFRHSKHTQLIRHAKVPVSKFVEPHTGIHCDLSIGNTTGVFKSVLLAEVLRMDSRVRDLVVIVKKWAKANRLNDPANGSFNSYCLTLLVLSFAQARSPPLIPPFRELFPGLRDVVCESQKDDDVDLIVEIDRFRKLAGDWRDREDRARNEETLCELLCAFFLDLSLFATHSQLLHYTAEGVSKSNSRPTASCWDSGFVLSAWDAKALKRYQLFVEDPFEAKDNCARTLATQDWWRIVKTLQETVHLVQEFVYASPSLQPEKWTVLWSFLFQYEPLPLLPQSMGHAEGIPRSKALLPLHRDCLVEHLNKFKASDKKFIAVSYSWWSKEFKQFVLTSIDGLGLFQGKGPKKKVIISKADNIKDDMVEHAVNSTLRARKTHNLVVDPYQCVMKQRLAEFLRCTIRYHKFRASYFDEETKAWLLRCVQEAGLKGKYIEGDLHLERPPDLHVSTIEGQQPTKYPEASVGHNGLMPSPVALTKLPEVSVGHLDVVPSPMPSGELHELTSMHRSPSEEVAGPLELDEPTPGEKLMSFALEDDDELDDDELWGDHNGTETCVSSCGELGTSFETNFLGSLTSEGIRVHLDVTPDETVRLHLFVIKQPRKIRKRGEELEELDFEDAVKLTLTTSGDRVSVGLESSSPAPPRSSLAELAPVEEETRDEDCMGHPPLLTNGLHERNAEILRHVFLDLFDVMEKLQDTDSFRGEIEIDPTEYVVPVSWVRQQVRDIARHLFLEIVVHNKRRRAMKIRIRKRARFEESESDDDGDYRRSYRPRDAKAMDTHYDQRSRPEIIDRSGGRYVSRTVDEEDHVTRCLLWIKGMKREKSMHFQSGIYPPEVMACLKERAEQMGLRLEVRDTTMCISVHPHARGYDEVPSLSAAKLATLNEKMQSAIRDYFVRVMMESRKRGVESFGLPTKGYFMRPEWVAKQVMEIGKRIGFDVKERDGTVELYALHAQGLARYFSVPDQLHIPVQQPPQQMMPGNLSRSFSGGHFPSPSVLNSHPLPMDGWSTPQSPQSMPFTDESIRETSSGKALPMDAPSSSFGVTDVDMDSNRRHRRSTDRRSNVREFSKSNYWENGCDNKNFDRRRGRGKGRRGRGRNNNNNVRSIVQENGKSNGQR